MKAQETKMTLEQYLRFYDDPWTAPISRPHLNDIIAMHGFTKLHQETKGRLREYLQKIQLAAARRSTLEQGVSSFALLTADEAEEDLSALRWAECTVLSLLTFPPPNSARSLSAFTPDSPPGPGPGPSSAAARRGRSRPRRSSLSFPRLLPADFIVRGRRPRSKRKHGSINALTAAASATGPTAAPSPPPSSSSASVPNAPLPPCPRSPTPPPPSPPPCDRASA